MCDAIRSAANSRKHFFAILPVKNVVWTPPKPFGWDRKRLQATKTSPVDLRSTFATAWTIESLHRHVVVETWPQSPCPILYTCGSSVTQARGGAAGLWGGGWGAGFFLELHLTLSGLFIPGGAEAGNSGRGGGDSGGRRRCRRCRNQPSNSELRARRILASPPFTARVREFALLFLAPPPPTHALETTNCFFVGFFLRLLGVNTQRLLFANCSRVLSVCAESFSSSPSSSSPVRQNAG